MFTFTDYQEYCRQLIRQRRPDFATLSEACQQTLLAANTPFEHIPTQPTQQAVILIHGLYDSPCIMQSLAGVFSDQNYLVRSVLLPGHGTDPEDLFTIGFEDWLTACRLAIRLLPANIERLVIAGFSTGALAAHTLALQQEIPQLVGLVSIAPALALHALQGTILKQEPLVHFAKSLTPWYGEAHVADYAKYTKYAINGAHQVQRLIQHYQQQQQALTVPVLYVLSANDKVINSPQVWQQFHAHDQHPQSRCLIYSPGPLNLPTDSRFIVRSSQVPEENILHFSHICLGIAPSHPHYGRHGDYTQALQAALPPGQAVISGEFDAKTTVRLTYNPDFVYLSAFIQQFLDTI